MTPQPVDSGTTLLLLKTISSGKQQPQHQITHHFPLADIMRGYDAFGNAAKEQALNVILDN